ARCSTRSTADSIALFMRLKSKSWKRRSPRSKPPGQVSPENAPSRGFASNTAEPGLVAHLYRARSLKAAGVHLVGATDAPVTPAKPLAAIAAAVSRTTIDGVEL